MRINRKKLEIIMAERDVCGTDIAKAANITTRVFSQARCGHVCYPSTARKIAVALGVNLVDIVGGDDSADPAPPIKMPKPKAHKAPPPAWKTDFDVYHAETVAAIKDLVKDEAWMAKMAQYHPRSDILLSIEKSMNTFWATEEGWENKKKSKSDKINWKSTIARTLQYSLVPKTDWRA